MHSIFASTDRVAQLHRKIARLERKVHAIDRIMQRRERVLEALDWSAMTVQDLEQGDWRGQDLHRDLWYLETAQSDAWLEYWGLTS